MAWCQLETNYAAPLPELNPAEVLRNLRPGEKRCVLCGTNRKYVALRAHIQRMHLREKHFRCGSPNCSYKAFTRREVALHYVHHLDLSPKQKTSRRRDYAFIARIGRNGQFVVSNEQNQTDAEPSTALALAPELEVQDLAQPEVPDLPQSEVQHPAQPEVLDPAQPEIPDFAQLEVQHPAQPEVLDLAQSEVPDLAQPEVLDPAQLEIQDPVQPEVQDPAQSTDDIELIPLCANETPNLPNQVYCQQMSVEPTSIWRSPKHQCHLMTLIRTPKNIDQHFISLKLGTGGSFQFKLIETEHLGHFEAVLSKPIWMVKAYQYGHVPVPSIQVKIIFNRHLVTPKTMQYFVACKIPCIWISAEVKTKLRTIVKRDFGRFER